MKSIRFILKRDRRKVPYRRENIAVAMWKSLRAVSLAQKSKIKNPFDLAQGGQKSKISEIAQEAASISISLDQLDKKSSEWKEAQRLAGIVENILVKSNGSHQWTVEEIQDVVEQVLLAAGHEDAAKAYILYRNRRTIVREGSDLSERSDPSRLGMSDNALAAMARRYLWKDKEGKVVETPRAAVERVAAAVAEAEKLQKYKFTKVQKKGQANKPKNPKTSKTPNSKLWREKYLEIMTSFEFVPAGCYFRGAGNKQNGSLANCFVLPVEDSIEQIFDAVKWSALIHMKGGGTGFNFSHLRPRGDLVRGGGLASGPINFMKAFDAETQIVMQGGEHRGANMGILNVDHPDIFEFIRAKSVDGEVSNFNVSVGAFDRFMEAVENDRQWPLVNPRDRAVVQNIAARSLWDQIIETAWKTGDPGMIYLDTINKFNPVFTSLGPIESTNVCGEQPLHPFDVCNLGSINLSKFVIVPWWVGMDRHPGGGWRPTIGSRESIASLQNDNINWKRLEEVIRIAVRFLDDGVDASTYPIPQIDDMAHKLRRIGLGVMGWADMLVKLGVKYNSDEGIKLAEMIMKFIQEISWDESERLAKEKGHFPLWEESYFNGAKNPFGRRRSIRNVAVTTIAPTGTISMIADCSSGIEPYFALEYTKNVVEKGGLKYTNRYFDAARRTLTAYRLPLTADSEPSAVSRQLSAIFPTAHEISPDWHVRMQAAFQKYTDNAVSKTINFPSTATAKDVDNAYMLAWKLGCKGITVYRDGSRDQQVLTAHSVPQTASRKPPAVSSQPAAQRLMQSQLQVTPLSQRAYRVERLELVEASVDGHCPECGYLLERTEGCELCHSCGYSRCSL